MYREVELYITREDGGGLISRLEAIAFFGFCPRAIDMPSTGPAAY